MLAVVSLWVTRSPTGSRLHDLRFEVASAVGYVNNWWQIFHHQSYFARFGPPSPLGHLWSLAVEEQFYFIWPFLLLLGVRFIPERARRFNIRPRLATVTFLVATASAIEMALLYQPSFDASRIYDGTDTRAFGLLFGAALAMVWPSRALTRRVTPTAVAILDVLGVVGLITIARPRLAYDSVLAPSSTRVGSSSCRLPRCWWSPSARIRRPGWATCSG